MDAWMIAVLGGAFVVAWIFVWARRQSANSGSKLAGLELRGHTLTYQGKSRSAKGAKVTIQVEGQIVQKSSFGNALLGGAVAGTAGAIGAAGKGTVDKRRGYLVIEAPTYGWSVPFEPQFMDQAYALAARINVIGRRSAEG